MSDPCAAIQQRLDSIVAEMDALRASFPKPPPPPPPAELRWYEHKIWALNQERMVVLNQLDNCRNPPPPPPTLYTDGAILRDRTGVAITLRGANLPLLDDWRFPGADNLDEVFKTGANAVRIQWYVNYPARPPYSVADLDTVLARCKTAGVIPILYLADLTGEPDPAKLNTDLIPWWTSQPVVDVLNKHADCLIINLANELGAYHFASDPAAAMTAYVDAYTTAIQSVRAAGLAMPVMIDAPDFGTSLDLFASAGPTLVAADPNTNLLLSAHAYWAATDRTSSIATCVTLGLPIVFGEIANKQDQTDADGNLLGYYDIDGNTDNPAPSNFAYQTLLPTLGNNAIGWLAWGWGPDNCAPRQLSSDGTFAALTPYGQDVVTNPTYGLTLATKANIPP